eukprot:sb/3478220/
MTEAGHGVPASQCQFWHPPTGKLEMTIFMGKECYVEEQFGSLGDGSYLGKDLHKKLSFSQFSEAGAGLHDFSRTGTTFREVFRNSYNRNWRRTPKQMLNYGS